MASPLWQESESETFKIINTFLNLVHANNVWLYINVNLDCDSYSLFTLFSGLPFTLVTIMKELKN